MRCWRGDGARCGGDHGQMAGLVEEGLASDRGENECGSVTYAIDQIAARRPLKRPTETHVPTILCTERCLYRR
jgi:hypothetical protein